MVSRCKIFNFTNFFETWLNKNVERAEKTKSLLKKTSIWQKKCKNDTKNVQKSTMSPIRKKSRFDNENGVRCGQMAKNVDLTKNEFDYIKVPKRHINVSKV